MIAPLLLTAQIGQLPPQLDLLTPPQAGTTLVYEMTGNLTGPGVPEFLLLDFQLLPIPLTLPPYGTLQLAFTPLLQILVGNGSGLFGVPVPPNPNFAGIVVHAQGFGFVFDVQSGSNRFTNLVSATLTAPDPQPRFLFVANAGDSTLSRFVIGAADGKLRAAGVQVLGGSPLDLAATPVGTYLYVLTPDRIEPFGIDPVDGSLAPVPSQVLFDAGVDPGSLALSPDGARLYLTDRAGDQVFGFAIGQNGALSDLPGSPWPLIGSGGGAQGPDALAIDEQGRFLCVANEVAGSLSVFTLASDGVPGGEVATTVDADPSALATIYQDTTEPRVVVTSRATDSVTVLQLAPDGSATIVGQATLATGAEPRAVAVERYTAGDRVHVANAGTGTVDTLELASSGQLSVPTPSLTGAGARDLVLADGIDRAYALFAGDHEVSTVAVDPSDGTLTPFEPLDSPIDRIRTREAPAAVAIVNGGGFAALESDRAYVAAREASQVGQFAFDDDQSSLTPLSPASASSAGKPNALAVHPTLDFLYATNFLTPGGNDLQVFDVSVQGKAAPDQNLDLDQPGESRLWDVDVDPTGSLVVATVASIPGRVVPLRVGLGGNLTELSGAAAGDIPRGGAFDQTGRFYYVANSFASSVSQYRVDVQAGTLTPLSPATAPAGGGPLDLVAGPNGRFVYVANSSSGNVTGYRIDAATGALSPIPGGLTPAGLRPTSLAMHPGGRYLVVGDDDGRRVRVFRINLDEDDGVEDGLLVELVNLLVGDRPLGLRFTADGGHLLVSLDAPQGADHVDTFAFDAVTGALTFLEQDPAGAEPRGLATRDRIE